MSRNRESLRGDRSTAGMVGWYPQDLQADEVGADATQPGKATLTLFSIWMIGLHQTIEAARSFIGPCRTNRDLRFHGVSA